MDSLIPHQGALQSPILSPPGGQEAPRPQGKFHPSSAGLPNQILSPTSISWGHLDPGAGKFFPGTT